MMYNNIRASVECHLGPHPRVAVAGRRGQRRRDRGSSLWAEPTSSRQGQSGCFHGDERCGWLQGQGGSLGNCMRLTHAHKVLCQNAGIAQARPAAPCSPGVSQSGVAALRRRHWAFWNCTTPPRGRNRASLWCRDGTSQRCTILPWGRHGVLRLCPACGLRCTFASCHGSVQHQGPAVSPPPSDRLREPSHVDPLRNLAHYIPLQFVSPQGPSHVEVGGEKRLSKERCQRGGCI